MGVQHTPGPWGIEGKFQQAGSAKWGFIISAGINAQHDGPAAYVGDLMVSEADARLIAAAPDLLTQLSGLLAAAKLIISAVNIDAETTNIDFRANGQPIAKVLLSTLLGNAETAIAKAEGRS